MQVVIVKMVKKMMMKQPCVIGESEGDCLTRLTKISGEFRETALQCRVR